MPSPPTPVDSDAVHSAGSWLEIETTPGGGSYTPIGESISITGPPRTMDTIEVTPLLATNKFRQHKASWKDGGEVTISVNRTWYYDSGQPLLQSAYDARRRTRFRIWWPRDEQGSAYDGDDFYAYVTSLSKAAERDSQQMLDVTLKIDGPVTPVF